MEKPPFYISTKHWLFFLVGITCLFFILVFRVPIHSGRVSDKDANFLTNIQPAVAQSLIAKLSLEYPALANPDDKEKFYAMITDGWQDCLSAFIVDRPWSEGKAWSYRPKFGEELEAPWTIHAPDELNELRKAGWLECQSALERLLRISSESEVRFAISSL